MLRAVCRVVFLGVDRLVKGKKWSRRILVVRGFDHGVQLGRDYACCVVGSVGSGCYPARFGILNDRREAQSW